MAYAFHLKVLTQHSVVFPFQLIPNDKGHFQSIGLDSLVGMVSFWAFSKLKAPKELPWAGINSTAKEEGDISPASPSVRAFSYLLVAYTLTGRLSELFERLLYMAVGLGVPMTISMHRSLTVLLGHLSWVSLGSLLLRLELQPHFFGSKGNAKTPPTTRKWYSSSYNTSWLVYVLLGYSLSCWIFNVSDFFNSFLLPARHFVEDGVVSKLVNPENNHIPSLLVGYVAPCLSAPWWEEVLYRGFMLPALNLHMGLGWSIFLSGILFSAHHMSVAGFLPLMALGWTWGWLYAKSGNLFVTMVIHAMWNSRVFLGSWLGL